MAKGSSAQVPDPTQAINAQALVDRYSTAGPTGTTTWGYTDQSPLGTSGGPAGGGAAPAGAGAFTRFQNYQSPGGSFFGGNIPNLQTTTLSPGEQQKYDLKNRLTSQNLTNAQGSANATSTPFDYSSATPDVAKAQYNKTVALLNPQFTQMDNLFEDRMQNAGIPMGSDAYKEALRQHEADKNTALTNVAADATTQGNQLALSQRQQNVNQVASALGNSQVTAPNAQGGGNIDAMGAYNQANQARIANANSSDAAQNANVSGGSMIAAALIF